MNDLNQLTSTVGGGPVRFTGRLSEAGTVLVANTPAVMGIQNTSFVAYAETANGTNVVAIQATDNSNNSRTNSYQVVVTNNGVAKTLSYDLNGNLTNAVTSTSTNSYEWDAANRLVAIQRGSARTEFTYDGQGRRVRIVEKNGTEVQSDQRFLWSGLALCEARNAVQGGVTRRYFAQGEQISGTNYLFTRDHLGSVREVTDAGGAVVARYAFDPYGQRTSIAGSLEADFGFTGHYYHAPSGLHLAPYRAYDADTGRWLNRDPIGEAGGLNLYAYVGNNPVNFYDPYGLAISDWWDPRTWFNSGFTDSWSDQANSIGQTWGDILTGNWGDIGNNYDDSTLGQAEAAGPGVHKATKVCIGTATVAVSAAVALEAAGVSTRIAAHGSHHSFGPLGRLPHAQLNWWRAGVKGSGGAVRIPVPPGTPGFPP